MINTSSYAKQEILRTDWQMLLILLAHIPVVGFLVPLGHDTLGFAAIATVLVGALAGLGYALLRGTRACSVLFASCLMLFSAIMIQAQLGRIEMHFHIFSALALVIIYRDWLPVVTAALVIAVHHLLLNALQHSGASLGDMPIIIFDQGHSWSTTFVHAAFVVFEAGILVFFAIRMNAERRQAMQIIEVVRTFGSDKDLSGRLDNVGDAVTATAFNDMMTQFSGLIGKVRDLSGRLRTNADTLTRASADTSRIITAQNQQTDQAAAATTEMTATIHEVAQNAQVAFESARKASDASSGGRESVAHSVQLTETTNAALEDSAKMVTELVEKVQSIGSVIGSINDISEQTNLLALNAAIEAARAGEHGRGFAVVADEVRNLSKRTQELTTDIRSTIDELAKVSEKTLVAIELGQQRSLKTITAVRETGAAISAIEQAIIEVSDMNNQIASASEEQAATSAEINQNVQRVADQNNDVVAEVEKSRQMAVQLENIIEEVDALVRVYRV